MWIAIGLLFLWATIFELQNYVLRCRVGELEVGLDDCWQLLLDLEDTVTELETVEPPDVEPM